MRLHGKVALITGGSSGIGLAAARRFAREGARLVLTGRRRDALDRAVAELSPAIAVAAPGDVTDREALARAVALAIDGFGRLDLVFANAGISGPTPLDGAEPDSIRRILDTNLLGPFLTVQAAAPRLGAGASVILNGSVHATLGIPGATAYAASKAGVRAMARNLAAELAPRDIRVNVVVPGATRTPIWDTRAPDPASRARLEAGINRSVPLERMAEADEVADAVLFLASEESRYVTAAELVVDGGLTGAPSGAPVYRA